MEGYHPGWTALLLIGGLTIGHTESAAQRTDTIVRLARAPRYSGVATLVPELKIGMVDGPPCTCLVVCSTSCFNATAQ